MNFADKQKFYNENFSLGHINGNFVDKVALVSLICYITSKGKAKTPGINCYQIIMKLAEGSGVPDSFCEGLAIICEDYMYGCTEFPTFELKGKDIISKAKELLKSYMPF